MNLEQIDTSTTAGKALAQFAELLKVGGYEGELRIGRAFGEALVAEIAALAPHCQPISSAHAIVLASAARAGLPFIAYAFDQGIEGAEEAGLAIEAALEVKSQWHPISTAPKDGAFYLATNGKDQRVENCPDGCMAGIWHIIDGDWRGYALGDDSTHWQPLPDAPEAGE